MPATKVFTIPLTHFTSHPPPQGRLASYDMGGYYTDAIATRAAITDSLADLKIVDWIDLQTRAIFVDFAV